MAEANELLIQQVELMKQLSKSLVNFKKTPKARLTKSYVQVRIQLLEEIWNKFNTNHIQLIGEEDVNEEVYIKEDYYSIAEESYTVAKCEMLEVLEQIEPSKHTASGSQNTTQTSGTSSQPLQLQTELKLPRITLPSFSGQYSEWIPFHDMYLSLIHRNAALKNVQKLHYLKSSLSGEAEMLLRHIQVTDKNYDDAWATLNKRYNNKRFIVNSLLKRLMSQKTISGESSNAIKGLLDTTNECLNALKNIGIETHSWDPMLVYITVAKLDSESVRLWEQHINNGVEFGDELPTFKELCKFLESRFRTLEVLESTKTTSKSGTRQYSFHTTANATCRFCNGTHFIYNCKEYARLSYVERREIAEKNGLCFNCLIPNHTVFRCRQRSSCRRCGKKHHSLLHPENKHTDPVSEESSGTSQIREQQPVAHTPVNHNVNAHYTDKELSCDVLLATALIKVHIQNGSTYLLRALIDQGSQGSFITESASQLLGLKKIPINVSINGLGDKSRSLNSKHMVIFNAHSRNDTKFEIPVKAFVLKSLTRMLPAREVPNGNWSHLHQLSLADPSYDKPGKIDLLLGAEVYSEIITEGLKRGPRGSPIAQNTHLGWILSGQLYNPETPQSYTITISMHTNIEVDNTLQRFWELESDVACSKMMTEEERRCEEHFSKTHKRDEEGRYIVSLPFKTDDPLCQYGSSKKIAERRLLQLERKLLQLERRLERDTELKNEYKNVMHEYLQHDHMEEIKGEEERCKDTAVYLPHHAVVRADKTTTKVRVVHDASCKYKNGESLNDNLMIGPRLQQDLRHIIMRWRQHKVCLVADIIKMYRQIKVNEPDFQRILWRDDPSHDIKDYRITRVTFGSASAPYLATKVLQQLAHDEAENYPIASNIALKDFYMDDLLTGGDSNEDGVLIYNQMTKLLQSGKFELQKWNSNDVDLLRYMNVANESAEKELNLDMTIKTLGITWNNKKDEFQYSIDLPEKEAPVTKRTIASDVSKLFDPLGWLAPTIITGKIFLQRLWLAGVAWDQEVSEDLKNDWLKYRSELPYISEITVDRWLHTATNDTKLELYGFADASISAYGAVVYSRVTDADGNIHIQLISAKTKVAPVKTVSVPRLELCGAVLLTRLLNEIAEHLNVAKENIYAHTDSKVVLSWIESHPSKWKTFIANRTSEIITNLPSHHWNHVISSENPADLASRGVPASVLKEKELWWKGPIWLKEKEIKHEVLTNFPKNLPLEERKVNFAETNLEGKFTKKFERFSTLEKLLRVIARCKRLKYRKQKLPTYLTAEEIENALSVCILLCQREDLAEDLCRLKESKPLKKNSKLRALNPFLDEKGVLRVGGRLRHANIPEDAKHQILLPNHNPLSKLIVRQKHKKTLHGGLTLMLNYIRQKYWILGAKNLIKQEVHRCVVCVRQKAATQTQLMGDLPSPRVTSSRPFLHSGVDFAGPIDLRMSKGRGCKTYKGYLSIFICMATRAMHIEIVSGLDSESFVAAFKRFTARRGHCSAVWSDNATNFIAGNKLLKDIFEGQLESVKTEIFDLLARDGTTWHNIPASAPHFGGLWEAGVRSVKHHLKRILGNTTLSYEEMSTVTTQIEACLNSRPISQISDDVNDLLPLTPGHFLIGEPPIVVPEKSYLDTNINRLNRWQLVQRLVQHFWQRWSREYLSRLQERPKWVNKIDNDIKIGSLVLVKDDNLPPGKWPLARILNIHVGKDGLVRVDPILDYSLPVKQLASWFDEIVVTRKREEISDLLKHLMHKYNPDSHLTLPDIAFPTLNGQLVETEDQEEGDCDKANSSTSKTQKADGKGSEGPTLTFLKQIPTGDILVKRHFVDSSETIHLRKTIRLSSNDLDTRSMLQIKQELVKKGENENQILVPIKLHTSDLAKDIQNTLIGNKHNKSDKKHGVHCQNISSVNCIRQTVGENDGNSYLKSRRLNKLEDVNESSKKFKRNEC